MKHFNSRLVKAKAITKVAKGFTLIELMVTISVAGVLTAIALPNLNEFLVRMRVDNEVIEIQRLLLTARNAAINSGQNAQLCPLAANNTCLNSIDWTGRIGVVSSDGLIKEKAAISTGDELEFAFNGITYNPAGQLTNNNFGTFSYCPKGYSGHSRGVEVTLSGRSSISSDNDGDGFDKDRTGTKISC